MRIATGILLFSLSVAFLWFFGCIWTYGSHYIQEPNRIILITETVGILGVGVFAVIYTVREIRRKLDE